MTMDTSHVQLHFGTLVYLRKHILSIFEILNRLSHMKTKVKKQQILLLVLIAQNDNDWSNEIYKKKKTNHEKYLKWDQMNQLILCHKSAIIFWYNLSIAFERISPRNWKWQKQVLLNFICLKQVSGKLK